MLDLAVLVENYLLTRDVRVLFFDVLEYWDQAFVFYID